MYVCIYIYIERDVYIYSCVCVRACVRVCVRVFLVCVCMWLCAKCALLACVPRH